MTTEIKATPEKIRELFNYHFIKLDNGNFLVPRGIENNKGHFNLTDDDGIGINGYEVKAKDFVKSTYENIEVFVFFCNETYPMHFHKAESVMKVVDAIQQFSDEEVEGGFQVDYNLHKDNSWTANIYKTLRGSEIGRIKLLEDNYNPRRKYQVNKNANSR